MKNGRPVILRESPTTEAMSNLGSLDPIHARLFLARGVTGADELDYSLSRMAPVSSLEHLDEAVDLLLENKYQRIVIVGDFDVDGATSTALLLRCLAAFGFNNVHYLVPNRFDYGYGLSPEIVRVAAEDDPGLLITVDNGISSIAGVAEAKRLGIDVLGNRSSPAGQ